MTCAIAPAKLILSGEHSIVYGKSAIVAAIDRHTKVCFTPLRTRSLRTRLKNLFSSATYPLHTLEKVVQRLDARFEQFLRGELPIQQILTRPDDLIAYTLASLICKLPTAGKSAHSKHLQAGLLQIESDLPIGAGLGSSASVIAATLVLYENMLNQHLSPEQRYQHIALCERLQHGKGSRLDATAITYGGLHYLTAQTRKQLQLPQAHHWHYFHHGTPESSTGECVAYVRYRHQHDAALWQAFADTTDALEQSLTHNPVDALKANHRLLMRIGVVSAQAAQLIAEIEHSGGAAKISGAGTIRGEKNGTILCYHSDEKALKSVLKKHYPLDLDKQYFPLQLADKGARMLACSV